MKKFLLLLALVINNVYAEGFLAGTLIKTKTGYIAIEQLEKDDLVLCYDGKGNYVEKPVTAVTKKETAHFLQFTINGEIINVAPEQKFYRPTKQRWTKAQHLTQKHVLLQHQAKLVRIDKIIEIEQEATVFAITVADHHNFLVSRQDIVVHNIFPFLIIMIGWGASAGGATVTVGVLGATITASATTVASALGVFGAAVAVGISRMGKRQGPNNPTSGNGGPSNTPSADTGDTGSNPDSTAPTSDNGKNTNAAPASDNSKSTSTTSPDTGNSNASSEKVATAVQTTKDYLGEGVKTHTNKNGDKVFESADGKRKVRFCINKTYPHQNVHSHVEYEEGGKWYPYPSNPIYPTNVPHV
jgi:hypothetical protein